MCSWLHSFNYNELYLYLYINIESIVVINTLDHRFNTTTRNKFYIYFFYFISQKILIYLVGWNYLINYLLRLAENQFQKEKKINFWYKHRRTLLCTQDQFDLHNQCMHHNLLYNECWKKPFRIFQDSFSLRQWFNFPLHFSWERR